MLATRRMNARRPSVMQRFTFVYEKRVTSEISWYDSPSTSRITSTVRCAGESLSSASGERQPGRKRASTVLSRMPALTKL